MNLEVFKKCIGKEITLELGSLNFRCGTITGYDDFGVNFVPSDDKTSDMIIAWHDINKVIMQPRNFVVIEPFSEG